MEPPSIEFSWNCTCRLPYRRFIQQATKKRKKNDSQKQPPKLKEYAAVKIVGRRTTIHLEGRYEARNIIFFVLWVELGLLDTDLLLTPVIIVEANHKIMQFLKGRAAFEAYQRFAENGIMEWKRKKLEKHSERTYNCKVELQLEPTTISYLFSSVR